MYYSIEKTLLIFPWLSWFLLATTLTVLEVRAFRSRIREQPEAELGRGGFVPPPGGYEYYVQGGNIVYLKPDGKGRFKVYAVKGDPPTGTPMKQDRHGRYFSIRCKDPASAERIVDQVYKV